jgi:hypothetical protein
MTWLASKTWSWSYELEEIRDHAQAERHLWTEAMACIGLALLRPWGC